MRGQNNVLKLKRERQLKSFIMSKSISKVFFLFTVCEHCSGFVLMWKLMCDEDGALAQTFIFVHGLFPGLYIT